MAVTVPTFTELYNSIISDLKNKLGINSLVGKTVLPAFAAVYAAKQKLQYLQIAKVNNNIFPDLADEDTLRRFGRGRLGRDLRPATAGEYIISVTGEVGATIPVGTTFSDKRGYLYVADIGFTFVLTTGSLTVRALTVGSESALQPDDELQLTSPLTNVDKIARIFSVTVIPVVAETVEEYRVNVVNSYRLLSQGGNRADYRIWTESVPGVREVYPYVKQNYAGEINLFIEAFPTDSTDNHGTPTNTILSAVQAIIEPSKIPMTVSQIHYLPIELLPVNVTIDNISDAGKLSEITDSITAYLYDIRPYIGGADIATDIHKGRLYTSSITQLVLDSGVSFDDVIVSVDGNDITSYEFENGIIPYLDSVTAI